MFNFTTEIIFAFGLFFGGIIGLSQYSASYSSNDFRKTNTSRSIFGEFFKSIGITCLASDGGRVASFSSATLLASGLLAYKAAVYSIFGAVVASSSASFFVVFDNKILIFILVGVGGIGYFFLQKRYIYPAKICILMFYLGLLLFGMLQMKSAFSFMSENSSVYNYLANEKHLLMFLVDGIILSIILQSGGAVTFLTIALSRAGLINYDQSFLILIGGTLGSAIRAQIYAMAFSGSAKQLISFFAGIKTVAFIVLLSFFIIFFNILGTLNTLENSNYFSNIALVYALASTFSNIISVLIAMPLVRQIEIFYNKLFPVDSLEKNSQAKYIRHIEKKDKKEWPKLIQQEFDYILSRLSNNFIEMTRKVKNVKYDNYHSSNKIIIETMDHYSKEFSFNQGAFPFNNANYELLILLKKLNFCINNYFKNLSDVPKKINSQITDAIIQHTDFLLLELSKCSTGLNLEEIRMTLSSLNDDNYRKRSQVLHENLLKNPATQKNDLIIKFINSYNDTIITAKMMLECFLVKGLISDKETTSK